MSFIDVLRLIGDRWRVVVVVLLLCVAASVGFTAAMTPRYASTAQVFVAVRAENTVGELAQGGSFSTQRVKSYPDLVASPLVLDPVRADLDLSLSTTDLAEQISADVPQDTVLINITALDTDPRMAADLANAVSEQFAVVVEDLEQTAVDGLSPVRVSTVRPATVQVDAISPRPLLNIGYGVLTGLVLGLAAAAIRQALDTTFKSEVDLAEEVGLAPLGTVPNDGSAGKQVVASDESTYSIRAETYRQIRTNLNFVDVDNPPCSIVVTSAVPREGKTVTSVNVAISLSKNGSRVCLIDADLRRPTIHALLGLTPDTGLTTVLSGRVPLAEALQHVSPTLSVLTSGRLPPNPAELLASNAMSSVLDQLSAEFDKVLIDSAPLLPVTDAAVLAAKADGVILVVRSRSTRHEQVRSAAESLRNVNTNLLGAVLNRVRVSGRKSQTYEYKYAARHT